MMSGSQLKEEKVLFEKLYEDEHKMRRAEEALKREINRDKVLFEKSNKGKNQDNQNQESCTVSSVHDKVEKLKNKLTKREKVKWRPEKLVCKRFELKDPYENVVLDDIEKNSIKKLGEKTFEKGGNYGDLNFNNSSGMNKIQKEILTEEANIKNYKTSGAYIQTLNNEKNAEIIVNSEVKKSIFDQIFDD